MTTTTAALVAVERPKTKLTRERRWCGHEGLVHDRFGCLHGEGTVGCVGGEGEQWRLQEPGAGVQTILL
jgi:hypothetical protein